MWILHFWGYNLTFWSILAKTNNLWLLWQFLVTNYKLVALIIFYLELEEPNCYMKKEGSKREHGPTFCFDFWVRFGDHRALYHVSIVIIPTLTYTVKYC